jgi:hypothetical protein
LETTVATTPLDLPLIFLELIIKYPP